MNNKMDVTISIEIPDLSDRLLAAKKQSGLSFNEIAEKVSVTNTAIWQILKGRNTSAYLGTVLAIGDALGIDLRDEIFEKVEDLLDETPYTRS